MNERTITKQLIKIDQLINNRTGTKNIFNFITFNGFQKFKPNLQGKVFNLVNFKLKSSNDIFYFHRNSYGETRVLHDSDLIVHFKNKQHDKKIKI